MSTQVVIASAWAGLLLVSVLTPACVVGIVWLYVTEGRKR